MIDLSRTYHTGIRVLDLDAAMEELGASLGVTWCVVQEREQLVWTEAGGAQAVPLRFTYSAEGPIHLELLQGASGSVWDATGAPGLHHLGVWTDDVAGETQRLIDGGWALVAASRRPEEGFGMFTYVAPPSGLIVELVDAALTPMFERWWAGGPLG